MEVFPKVLSAFGIATGLLLLIRKYRELFLWGWCQSSKRMDGKVVVITGANCGIGKETAKDLARRGAIVILACRNKQAALDAIQSIRNFTKDGDVIFVELNLSSLQSIKKCAENILSKFPHIDVLVNNAGVSFPPEREERTEDGLEIHFGVNHLGHFYLTNLLLERLKETDNSRIVTVSSMLYKQGSIDFDNLRCEKGYQGGKGRNPLYNASKLANVLHSRELYKRLNGTSVGVYCLSPGFVYTSIFRYHNSSWWKKLCFLPIAIIFMRSCRQGAQTPLHCVVSEELDSIPFGFYNECKLTELASNALDDKISHRLWETSRSIIDQVMK